MATDIVFNYSSGFHLASLQVLSVKVRKLKIESEAFVAPISEFLGSKISSSNVVSVDFRSVSRNYNLSLFFSKARRIHK